MVPLSEVRNVGECPFNARHDHPLIGHLVVKSTGKCLSLVVQGEGPPFTVTSSKCYYSDDSGQVFSNVVRKQDGDIYFAGVCVMLSFFLTFPTHVYWPNDL